MWILIVIKIMYIYHQYFLYAGSSNSIKLFRLNDYFNTTTGIMKFIRKYLFVMCLSYEYFGTKLPSPSVITWCRVMISPRSNIKAEDFLSPVTNILLVYIWKYLRYTNRDIQDPIFEFQTTIKILVEF